MHTLKPFDYFEPATVQEATRLLSKYGDKAQVLAGGVDLIPRMRKEKIKADFLVNIRNIPELNTHSIEGKKGLRFGAMTSLHTLELSRDVQKLYPILYEAIHQIASVQAKCMGTAVGNLCVATPASDVATALMALGAELAIAGPDKTRNEPIEKFYVDYLKTSLRNGEMVTGVFLPGPMSGSGTGYLNLLRTKGDSAKVSVAVAVTLKNGICQEAKISLGAVAPTVFRAAKAEAVLKGQKLSADLMSKAADTAVQETQPITDVRSTGEYRKVTTGVLVARALEKAVERAKA
jgi:carbon-monoxide dehydrogenase medium subunit